jgi:hypothetical protein
MKRALEFFGGGSAVYLLMAACSASGGSGPSLGEAGSGPEGQAGQGGAPIAMAGAAGVPSSGGRGGSASGGKGGTGPVPDADAATPGSRLKPKVFIGADGSRQPTTLWNDTQRDEECSFRKTADAAYRCLPTSSALTAGGYYQDANCSIPILAVPVPCGPGVTPKYVLAEAACGADGIAKVYEPISPSGTSYVGVPGNCTFTSSVTHLFFQVGTDVPLESFARAELRAE